MGTLILAIYAFIYLFVCVVISFKIIFVFLAEPLQTAITFLMFVCGKKKNDVGSMVSTKVAANGYAKHYNFSPSCC